MRPADSGEGRPTLVIAAGATPLDMSDIARCANALACVSMEIAVGTGQAAMDCDAIRSALATHKLKCAGLSFDSSDTNLGTSDAGVRAKARERIANALQNAVRLGASYVRLVATQLDTPGVPRYADASHHVLEALLALRHEAGLSGVRIVLHLADHGFLASLTEARKFLDAVNSPWVGGAINFDAFGSTSTAIDWIETLTHRLTVVCASGSSDGNLDWAAIGRALAAERFDGFVVAPKSLDEQSRRVLAPVLHP